MEKKVTDFYRTHATGVHRLAVNIKATCDEEADEVFAIMWRYRFDEELHATPKPAACHLLPPLRTIDEIMREAMSPKALEWKFSLSPFRNSVHATSPEPNIVALNP